MYVYILYIFIFLIMYIFSYIILANVCVYDVFNGFVLFLQSYSTKQNACMSANSVDVLCSECNVDRCGLSVGLKDS